MTTCDTQVKSGLRIAIALSALHLAPSARAQAQDQAAARSLFNEGRALITAGKYKEACPKLEAASTLFQSAGILLNLADCLEKIGRTASAWTEFGDAATLAERANRDGEAAEAKQRQAALEPKLCRLTIIVSSQTPGLTVKRDGSVLSSAAWAAAIPVDPGDHEIRAEAPGREPWSTTISVTAPGQTVPVNVPDLSPVGAAGPPVAATPANNPTPPTATDAPPTADSSPSTGSSTTLDWALIGGGAAVLVGGAVLMGVESGRASDSRKANDPAEYQSTKTPWAIGVTGIAVGGVAAAAGAVLLMMHKTPSAPATSVRPLPWVASSGAGLDVGGSF